MDFAGLNRSYSCVEPDRPYGIASAIQAQPSYAAKVISRCTARPARTASATSASRLNLPTWPRSRSFRRGCVTPRRLAASVWVTRHPDTASLIAMIRLERSFMFSASVGVFSSASHTLSKTSMVIASSLLERVKHVNDIRERGDIDYSEGVGTPANPDLANSRADRRHRPPIVGVEPSLYPIQLVSRFPPRVR